MEQLTLFGEKSNHYKYLIDASAIISQKPSEPLRRSVMRGIWEHIDTLVNNKIIVTCSEILDEINSDPFIENWLKSVQLTVLEVDEDIQRNVIKVVTENPALIDFKQMKSSGDAFLIATAMKHNLVIITEEKKNSPKKIPQIACNMGVKTLNILELCEEMGKQF